MVPFARVLDDVERLSSEARRASRPFNIGLAEPLAPQNAEKPEAAAQAIAAYRSLQGEPPAPRSPANPRISVDTEMAPEAIRSPRKLKALRRQLAWRLHPDRGPDGDWRPLAEINAAIDAALAQCANARE
jgi:hypothetical protein